MISYICDFDCFSCVYWKVFEAALLRSMGHVEFDFFKLAKLVVMFQNKYTLYNLDMCANDLIRQLLEK